MNKIIWLFHNDIDWMSCAFMFKKIFPEWEYELVNHTNIDRKFETAVKQWAVIVCADIAPDEKIAQKAKMNENIYIFDHHSSSFYLSIMNVPNVVWDEHKCAAKIMYDFFEKLHKIKNLKQYINIIDEWDHSNEKYMEILTMSNMYWEKFVDMLDSYIQDTPKNKEQIENITQIEEIHKNNLIENWFGRIIYNAACFFTIWGKRTKIPDIFDSYDYHIHCNIQDWNISIYWERALLFFNIHIIERLKWLGFMPWQWFKYWGHDKSAWLTFFNKKRIFRFLDDILNEDMQSSISSKDNIMKTDAVENYPDEVLGIDND